MKSNKSLKKKWGKELIKNIKKSSIKKRNEIVDTFSEFLEIPKELVTNMTKITTIENRNVMVEGYNQIIDYYDDYIKIRTNNIDLIIDGKDLDIKEITDTDLIIQGEIFSINYKGG